MEPIQLQLLITPSVMVRGSVSYVLDQDCNSQSDSRTCYSLLKASFLYKLNSVCTELALQTKRSIGLFK